MERKVRSKRDLVLEEAARQLNARGVSQASVSEIARALGLTRAALYGERTRAASRWFHRRGMLRCRTTTVVAVRACPAQWTPELDVGTVARPNDS